jgi:methyltransferase family protein
MRHFLRRTFDSCVAALPPSVLRGFFKTFVTRNDVAERAGFQVYPKVFYSPFADPAEVNLAALSEPRPLPGVSIDGPRILGLVEELAQFKAELDQFPRDPKGSVPWSQTYPTFDTIALYSMLRKTKPKRYIEVGCGWSTRASIAALKRNQQEGAACESLFIEPYPAPYFLELKLPGEFLRKKIQDVPLDRFAKLEAGDVLFIDTSHVLKVQNDVEYELTRVLPSLKKGVHVHVHDIFTPYDYPAEWLVGNGANRGANNEQYALEILISGGRDWEVTLPLYWLWRQHRPVMEQWMPGASDRPQAIWIRKKESAQ